MPLVVRAGRPRSRVGPARDLVRANGLRSRAASPHGAPNLPLRGSVPSCHLWCGRDARVPGWVSPVALCVQTAFHPGLLSRMARQTGLYGDLFRGATYGAGGTPAFPGGSRSQPYACKRAPIQGYFLAWRAKPAFTGICSVVPYMVRAGRPRSRVGLARRLMRANGLRSRAAPSHGAPNGPLGDLIRRATYGAGGTPAFPGGSRP